MYDLIHSIVDQTLNFQKDLTLDGIRSCKEHNYSTTEREFIFVEYTAV